MKVSEQAVAIVEGWLGLGDKFRTPAILSGMIAHVIADERAKALREAAEVARNHFTHPAFDNAHRAAGNAIAAAILNLENKHG
jgi:hypothetical protein